MSSGLDTLKTKLAEVNALHAAIAVMDWDQQCLMPPGGGEARAEHVGHLSGMAHDKFVDDVLRTALDKAAGEVEEGSDDAAIVRNVRRDLDIQSKLPAELVSRKARLSALAHEEWVKARAENDFASFVPTLSEMFEIAREEASHIGYTDHPYDALTDMYEEGASKKYWDAMFDQIRQPLTDLVAEIADKGQQPDDSILYGDWDEAAQRDFSLHLIKSIGFDMERGRLDTAAHPFCTNFSVGDVRLTTRFKDYLPSAIFGSLHEAGHGMYEQGSPMKWDRTPIAGGVSLGFHESQSRTWENIVGRSKAFWQHFYPSLQKTFPTFGDVSLETFYKAVNKAEPSLIRVEADEVTYNLHILVRFELECLLLNRELEVKDLPEAWNSRYEKYLGITPPTDADGCMQDVHWSAALIGYFPTYSMGNILSYQIWNELEKSLGDADALIAKGEFEPILGWLIDNLYQYGSKVRPQELLKQITGGELDAQPYLTAITNKYRDVYSLS